MAEDGHTVAPEEAAHSPGGQGVHTVDKVLAANEPSGQAAIEPPVQYDPLGQIVQVLELLRE